MAERAKSKLEQAISKYGAAGPPAEAGLGAVAAAKPISAMTAAEALGAASLQGLRRLYEIVSTPLDPEDLKQQRLIGDMAVAVNRLFMRAAEGEFRQRRDDALSMLLAELARERGK